jgi:hypothetical protein
VGETHWVKKDSDLERSPCQVSSLAEIQCDGRKQLQVIIANPRVCL